ncbi:MAG TPA: hypothetical protein VKZ98_03340 [Aquaticitalea sp.]|nr:hypothetical protein [Aquaticitalea sp.]
MKALKITLLIALFVSVSSQTDKKPAQDSVDTYETTNTHYDLLAHAKKDITLPTQG